MQRTRNTSSSVPTGKSSEREAFGAEIRGARQLPGRKIARGLQRQSQAGPVTRRRRDHLAAGTFLTEASTTSCSEPLGIARSTSPPLRAYEPPSSVIGLRKRFLSLLRPRTVLPIDTGIMTTKCGGHDARSVVIIRPNWGRSEHALLGASGALGAILFAYGPYVCLD